MVKAYNNWRNPASDTTEISNMNSLLLAMDKYADIHSFGFILLYILLGIYILFLHSNIRLGNVLWNNTLDILPQELMKKLKNSLLPEIEVVVKESLMIIIEKCLTSIYTNISEIMNDLTFALNQVLSTSINKYNN